MNGITTQELIDMCANAYPKHYGYCDVAELRKDIMRFYVIKRMCNRYVRTGQINHKGVINQFITVTNLFEVPLCMKVIECVLNEAELSVLHGFTNFFGITQSKSANIQITDMLADVVNRV